MAVAAEALLKLRAVFDGEGFDRAARAIDGIENTARRSKRNFKNVLNSDAWQGAAVGATGIGAGLIYSAKKAIELDTQMAQVRKVVDFETPQGLINMRRGLVDLSREIPYTAKELAEIAASGGMAGFTEKEIPKFVKAAATMGTAFNIPAKEAGDAMVAMQAGMGLTLDGAVDLGDAINHLSDNMKGVVEPAALVDVVKRVGAVGKASGLSAENVAALGAAFLAPGTNAEVAATGMKNFLNALTKGDAGSAPFRKAMDDLMGYPGAAKRVARDMQTDAVGTIKTVLERIAALPKDIQPQMVSQIFGEESKAAIMPLLTNTKLLSEAFGMVGTKSKYAGSMQKEFANQMNTTEAQLKLFKNNVDALAIGLGEALLHGINAVLMGLRPFVSALIFATQKVPGLSTAIVALGLAFAGLVISAPFIAGLITIANAARGLWASGTAARALGTALSTVLRGSAGGGAGFFAGLINAAKAVPGLVMGALRVLPGMVAGLFRGLGGAMGLGNIAQGLRTFFDTLRGFTPTMVMQGGQWVVPWTVRLGTALRSILPVMALVGRAVAGVFSGPVGWVALLITAGVALFTFRNQIGQFAAWVKNKLSGAFQPIKDFALGKQQTQPGQPAQQSKGVNPIDAILAPLNPTLLGARIGQAITQALAGLGPAWERLKQGISNVFNAALQGAFQGATSLFNTFFIIPIQGLWNFLVVWIGQTIAAYAIVWWRGISANFHTNVVIPIQTMWTNFVTWIGTTVAGIQGRLSGIWFGISTLFQQHVTAPIAQWWNWLVGTITQGAANLRNILAGWWAGISTRFQAEVVTPIAQAWNQLTTFLGGVTGPLRNALNSAWQGVATNFNQYVVQPVSRLWSGLTTFVGNAAGGMVRAFQGAWANVAGAVRNAVIVPLQNMFSNLASRIRSIFDGLLGWARGIANWAVDAVNNVRQQAGFQPLQRFAKGGYVNGPTLGLIGEGRDPREYIIPERKMAGAAMNYLSGKRGASVLSGSFARGGYVNKPTLGLIGEARDNKYVVPERKMAASAMSFLSGARGMDVIDPPRFANGGVVGSSMRNRSGNLNALLERTGTIGGQTVVVQDPTINATIQVQTGDVLQFEGRLYVTLSDYQRGLKQVQNETLGLLRTAQGRRATGR